MKHLFILFSFLVLFNTNAREACANGVYLAMGGATSSPCSQYLDFKKSKESNFIYQQTANGIITGINIGLSAFKDQPVSVGSRSTTEYRDEYIENYCLEHPDAKFHEAVFSLYYNMIKNSL